MENKGGLTSKIRIQDREFAHCKAYTAKMKDRLTDRYLKEVMDAFGKLSQPIESEFYVVNCIFDHSQEQGAARGYFPYQFKCFGFKERAREPI